MARDPMEAEISSEIGADLGERSSERVTHRNGYRTVAIRTVGIASARATRTSASTSLPVGTR